MNTYYLNCYNCNKLNEFKSEYQTFCEFCNKKLVNNFPEWEKSNPDKTIQDFKEIFGIRSDTIVLNHKRKGLKIPKQITTIIGVFFGIILGYYLFDQSSSKLINLFNFNATRKEILEKEWYRNNYLGGLTVAVPDKLEKGKLDLPLELKNLIDKHEVYESKNKKGFRIWIQAILFKPEAAPFSLEGAALSSLNEVKNQKGVTDFFYSQKSFNLSNNIPGFIQRGSFKMDGYDIEFINTGFNLDLFFWQVLVAHHINDEIGKKAARRVIDSVEINSDPL